MHSSIHRHTARYDCVASTCSSRSSTRCSCRGAQDRGQTGTQVHRQHGAELSHACPANRPCRRQPSDARRRPHTPPGSAPHLRPSSSRCAGPTCAPARATAAFRVHFAGLGVGRRRRAAAASHRAQRPQQAAERSEPSRQQGASDAPAWRSARWGTRKCRRKVERSHAGRAAASSSWHQPDVSMQQHVYHSEATNRRGHCGIESASSQPLL